MGCRKIVAQFALGVVLCSGLGSAGWAASAQNDASFLTCHLTKVADRFDDIDNDGHTGDGRAVASDPRELGACAGGTTAGANGRDKTIFFTPVLQDHDDLMDDTTVPVRQIRLPRAARLPAV